MSEAVRARPGVRRQQGLGLITAILLLVLISVTIVGTIQYSGEESKAGGRARAAAVNLHAADSGIQLGLERIQVPRDLTAFSLTLANGTTVQSRRRDQATPQDIVEAGVGAPPEGYSINVGSGYVNELFDLSVTATGVNGGATELSSRLSSLQPNSGAY